ncbi:uncharacterized protein LOC122994068 [Thunnus albacares]|uniref:uncharacterized protein LOC122994068 n=1 Tax=Thunnus albacares TaxID=8236 RepID=UPI001CF61838|nr:uncharacterized protein LOC122994068 [Thunnus albacares]
MFCSSPECKGQDSVTQPTGDFIAAEGDTVTLACTFQTSDPNTYLFWYKQEVNDSPKYILQRYSGGGDNAAEFQKNRFDATLNKTSVPLTIQKLQLSDSAVYYCALFPGLIAGDTISPVKEEVSGREGESVTLTCTYQTSYSADLYWYKYHSDLQAPQFILFKGARGSRAEYIPDKRYKSQTSYTSTELTIQSLTLADTALYYCDSSFSLTFLDDDDCSITVISKASISLNVNRPQQEEELHN